MVILSGSDLFPRGHKAAHGLGIGVSGNSSLLPNYRPGIRRRPL
jgi:hypothetical protein